MQQNVRKACFHHKLSGLHEQIFYTASTSLRERISSRGWASSTWTSTSSPICTPIDTHEEAWIPICNKFALDYSKTSKNEKRNNQKPLIARKTMGNIFWPHYTGAWYVSQRKGEGTNWYSLLRLILRDSGKVTRLALKFPSVLHIQVPILAHIKSRSVEVKHEKHDLVKMSSN